MGGVRWSVIKLRVTGENDEAWSRFLYRGGVLVVTPTGYKDGTDAEMTIDYVEARSGHE